MGQTAYSYAECCNAAQCHFAKCQETLSRWRHDTQHNDIQHKYTEHIVNQHNNKKNATRSQGDQKFWKKFAQILEKVAKTIAKLKKCIRIFIKAQFESSKSLCQTFSKLLKCLQQTIFFNPNNCLSL
jgi:hypothetical protein